MRSVGETNNFALALFFIFKSLPMFVAAMSIYLGYKLFVLGVTGEASIVIDAKEIGGQLINAAPGLFFALGGIIMAIVAVIKGAILNLDDPEYGRLQA